MKQALFAFLLVPGFVGGSAFLVPGRGNRHVDPSATLAQLLTGRFEIASRTTPDGTLPAVTRVACPIDAAALGGRGIYVEDSFVTRAGQPFSQRVYLLDPTDGARVTVREFTLEDPSSLRGACGRAQPARLDAAAVHERGGCSIEGRVTERGFDGSSTGRGCSSVLNGAEFVTRRIEATRHHVIVTDQGFEANGALAWGHADGLRYQRVGN